MLNLDTIINQAEEVVIFGEHIHVKQPSVRMYMQISEIEKDLNESNLLEKRVEVAQILLNNNTEGRAFEKSEVEQLPRSAIETLVILISEMKIKADNDPNSKSPSPKVK